jgi:tripartite-type tricarboxylate transporter receptor subunit TctC
VKKWSGGKEVPMYKRLFSLIAVLAGFSLVPIAASSAAPFYEGKTVRVIVGFSAGGLFDLYARVISRHLGRHIEGNPTIVVENVVGAGGLIATAQTYHMAKPDGLTLCTSVPQILNQLMKREGVDFDVRKFEYIGSPLRDIIVFVVSKKSGITNTEQWLASRKVLKFGGLAPGTYSTDNPPKIAKAGLGFPLQLVTGYKGTANIRLAIESGELDGVSVGWITAVATWGSALEKGDVNIVMQVSPKAIPELPKVPLMVSFAKTDEARKMIKAAIDDNLVVGFAYIMPPGTPAERVAILRKAFQETLKDKEFLAEAENAKLKITPMTGEEVKTVVDDFFKLEPDIIAKLKKVLYE